MRILSHTLTDYRILAECCPRAHARDLQGGDPMSNARVAWARRWELEFPGTLGLWGTVAADPSASCVPVQVLAVWVHERGHQDSESTSS